jgi:hypothetical protein
MFPPARNLTLRSIPLYDYFTRAGDPDLITGEKSMRYVSFHRHSPPHRDDVHASQHPLLPLGTLDEDPVHGVTKRCVQWGCALELFALELLVGSCRCFVCHAVDGRQQPRRRSKCLGSGWTQIAYQQVTREHLIHETEARRGCDPGLLKRASILWHSAGREVFICCDIRRRQKEEFRRQPRSTEGGKYGGGEYGSIFRLSFPRPVGNKRVDYI